MSGEKIVSAVERFIREMYEEACAEEPTNQLMDDEIIVNLELGLRAGAISNVV